jgi:uncharacterized protein YihD (DUF1040 family)
MASEVHGKYLIVSRPNYQADKELWLLYYFVMWGDENGFHSHQFKILDEVSSLKEKRKASASLKLGPGLAGNFEHQLFL